MHHRPISSSTPRTSRRTVLHAALAVPLALGLAGQAAAQSAATAFPSKTIRFVVPYPPGGPTDLMARMLQPELQSRLGVPVVVDNKGGAGGNTGSAEVAKQAPADGHTLLLAASGPMAVNPSLYASMPFNPLTDLAPVIQLSAFPLVLEVHPSLGITGWHGIAVRAGTPQATIDKLNATVNAIFKDPAFRTKWEAIGTPVVAGNAADFGALIKADAQRLGKLVRDAGVTVD
eukprot:gene4242-4153_t